ncbi:MAG: hypothetical protein J6Y65_02285, partial [Eggerthellaceae bacterium]|nr:hypothetical protein [Eggerthellaceae bacterium]
MAVQTINYQCPKCGGNLYYSSKSAKLRCRSCESEFAVDAIDERFAEKHLKANKRVAEKGVSDVTEDIKVANAVGGTERMVAAISGGSGMAGVEYKDHLLEYTCSSCGAQLVCDDTTTATLCPYCNNPAILPGTLSGVWEPARVLPFKISKDDAKEIFKKHCKGKAYLPNKFSGEAIFEGAQGVYIPYWLYAGKTEGIVEFEATKVHSSRVGDTEIIDTDYYHLTRSGRMAFEDFPIDASEKMPDTIMDSLEPFDLGELVKFTPSYLPGFLAQRFDEGSDACKK